MFVLLFKYFYVSNQIVCGISLHGIQSLPPYLAICFVQITQKRHHIAHLLGRGMGGISLVHSMIRVVAFFPLCFCSISRHTDCDTTRACTIYIRENIFSYICNMMLASIISFTVISIWCNLCEIYSRICLLLRPEVVMEPACSLLEAP